MASSKGNTQRELFKIRRQLRVIMKDFYGHLKCLQRVVNPSEGLTKCTVLYGEIFELWQRVGSTLRECSPSSEFSEARVLVLEFRNKVDEFGHFSMGLVFELSAFNQPEGIKSVMNTSQKASTSDEITLDVEGGCGPGGPSLARYKLPQWMAKLMLALSGQMLIQLLSAQTSDQNSTFKVTLAVIKAFNVVGFICLLLGLNICRRKSLISFSNVLQRVGAVIVTISFVLAMSANLPLVYILISTLFLAAPISLVLLAF